MSCLQFIEAPFWESRSFFCWLLRVCYNEQSWKKNTGTRRMRWNSNLFSMPKKKLLFQLSLIAHSKHRARLPSSRHEINRKLLTIDDIFLRLLIVWSIDDHESSPRFHQWEASRHEWKRLKNVNEFGLLNSVRVLDKVNNADTVLCVCWKLQLFHSWNPLGLKARSLAARLIKLERVGALKTPLGVF